MGSVGRNNQTSNGMNISTKSLKNLSLDELRTLDRSFQEQERLMDDRLATIASNNPAYNMPQEYYDIQRQKQDTQDTHRVIINEIVERNSGTGDSSAPRTFVNSYGEATQREITTSTYEREQRKLQRQILKLIGG